MGCRGSKSGREATAKAEARLGGDRNRFLSFDSRVVSEWKAGDKDGDGVLSLKEVKRLLHKLNVAIPERELKKQFARFDEDKNGNLDFDEFQQLFAAVQSKPDLREVFAAAGAGQDAMVAEELQRYITSSSAGKLMPSTLECARLILKYEGADEAEQAALREGGDGGGDDEEQFLEGPLLSYDGFLRMLTDAKANSVVEATSSDVYQDMTHPLSHYFISASHNTYLHGNQLNGESQPAAIAKALRSGVRVIELDAWDGGDGQPIVNHGHTMCKPTSFRACLEAINECAFAVSEHAVIITIENHCSMPQQKVQIKMLSEIFGAKLFNWPGVATDGKVDWTVGPPEWVSPADVKGKIVIRDKPHKKKSKKKDKADGSGSGSGSGSAATSPSSPPSSGGGDTAKAALAASGSGSASASASASAIASATASGSGSGESFSLGSLSMAEGEDDEDDEDVDAAKKLGVDEALLRIMYIKNVKMKLHHDKAGKAVQYTEPAFRSSSSIVEGKMVKLSKPGYPLRDLAAYAQRHLVRVYPAGSRVDSSNYDPSPAWSAGCQVVALNYQTHSMPLWLNQGKFGDNGGCGYVLKPDFLLPSAGPAWTGVPADVAVTVSVTVMSGHYLPKPLGKSEKSEVIDPYVEVAMHGLDVDQKKFSTKHVNDNGFNPTWNEKFTFDVHQPELALLSFVVNDHDLVGKDDFIGQRVVPLTTIVPGHKMVQLDFSNGAPQDSFLFIRIQFDPAPP